MTKRRLTIEYIREQFEKEKYILLTKEYINNTQKLEYICSKGHGYNISWNSWQKGRRCYYCGIDKSVNKRKENIEFVKSEFKKEGYKLLTEEYINCEQKLEYICPNGHRHNISWSAWKNQDQRCSFCYGRVKLTIEYVKEQFNKEGYELLSEEYINANTKLKYRCPKGHEHSITWTNWHAGYRCYYCFGNVSPTIEFIRKEAEKENYEMISNFYINNRQLLEYICPNGHRYKSSWSSWQQARRCWKCYCVRASLNKIGNKHWNWKNYSEKELEEISNYKSYVSQLTENNYKKYKSTINPLNLPRRHDKYHLDHIYSIIMGFENSVLPKIISCPFNLRMLKAIDNLSKNGRSNISLEELYNRYNNWEGISNEV